jgi:quinol monooxygenase YgiN
MSVVLFSRIEVADYDAWKAVFDSYDDTRQANGQMNVQLFRDIENPNIVTVISHWESMEGVQAFQQTVDVPAAQKQGSMIENYGMAVMSEV